MAPPAEATVTRGETTPPQPRREGEREAERRYKETLKDVSREGSSEEISRDAKPGS